MKDDTEPREAAVIKRARKAMSPTPSIRSAAQAIGLSEGRWRQIEAGYQTVRAGERSQVVGPAETVARMAHYVGVDPQQLRDAGRDDAADELESLLTIRERVQYQRSGGSLRPQESLGRGLAELFPAGDGLSTATDMADQLRALAAVIRNARNRIAHGETASAAESIIAADALITVIVQSMPDVLGATATRNRVTSPAPISPAEGGSNDVDSPSRSRAWAEAGAPEMTRGHLSNLPRNTDDDSVLRISNSNDSSGASTSYVSEEVEDRPAAARRGGGKSETRARRERQDKDAESTE